MEQDLFSTPLDNPSKYSTHVLGKKQDDLAWASLYYGSGAINRISRENNGPADEKCNYARSKRAVERAIIIARGNSLLAFSDCG
jgi:hypothetical protein